MPTAAARRTRRATPPAPQVALLTQMIADNFAGPAWHGPALRATVRRIDAPIATWRPDPHRHNIAEHVAHCAYWKYATRRRLTCDKRGSFPLKGSNWFPFSTPLATADWRALLRLLDHEHEQLLAALASLTDATLARVTPGAKYTTGRVLFGIASHDTYHAGQVQFLKRLATGAAGA